MGYIEITVLVDGAETEVEQFTTVSAEERFCLGIQAEAMVNDLPVSIYRQYHGHAPEAEECACAQYATDHHPFWTNEVSADA